MMWVFGIKIVMWMNACMSRGQMSKKMIFAFTAFPVSDDCHCFHSLFLLTAFPTTLLEHIQSSMSVISHSPIKEEEMDQT